MGSSTQSQHQDLTHREQMGEQNSPIIAIAASCVIAWAGATMTAKELGYKNARQMFADAWQYAVTAVSAKSAPQPSLKSLEPK